MSLSGYALIMSVAIVKISTRNLAYLNQCIIVSTKKWGEGSQMVYVTIQIKSRGHTDMYHRQEKYMLQFCHFNESISIDSNSKRVVEVKRGHNL